MTNVAALISALVVLSTIGAAEPPTAIHFDGLRYSNPGPTFDHGFVAAWDLKGVHSLTLYGPDGREMFDVFSFTLPDGVKTDAPLSVAIDSDAMSVYAYWAQSATRSGIAILDSAGNQIRIIETQPYKPSQVCFAPDHSIWMFGNEWEAGDRPAPDFMAFRHYSRQGKLLGSFVPRSALPKWEGGGWIKWWVRS